MKPQELKNIIAAPNATILSEAFPLYQRNLVTDATGWLRQIEAKAKQLKNGKVVLIAVINV